MTAPATASFAAKLTAATAHQFRELTAPALCQGRSSCVDRNAKIEWAVPGLDYWLPLCGDCLLSFDF